MTGYIAKCALRWAFISQLSQELFLDPAGLSSEKVCLDFISFGADKGNAGIVHRKSKKPNVKLSIIYVNARNDTARCISSVSL